MRGGISGARLGMQHWEMLPLPLPLPSSGSAALSLYGGPVACPLYMNL